MTPTSAHRRRAGATVAALGLVVAGLALPVAASGDDTGADDPKRVVYVEANNNDMANVADYTLEGTNRPAFDMAMIFAANINYDATTRQAYLHLNERVTETLAQAYTQIRPLQERGTKVLLSVLGNHQGAGFANFTSAASAAEFADQLADAVEQYGLDGIDFDDEWSKYGENGTAQPNSTSFAYLLEALDERLGDDKLITLYAIGESYTLTDWQGTGAAQHVDYAWNPYYGWYSAPSVPGLAAPQLGAAAVDLTSTPQATAADFAQRTVVDGHGVYVTYNLTAGDHSDYISSITVPLTGLRTAYKAAPIVEYDVSSSVAATCTGGGVKVKVRVANDGDKPISVTVASSIGSRNFAAVAAGDDRTVVQHARKGAVADGTVTLTLKGAQGTVEKKLPYTVPAC